MGDLFDMIVEWADDKGILAKSSPLKQHVKTQEEVNEVLEAVLDGNQDELALEIGDVLVTLTIQAKLNGLDLYDCLERAYEKIATRKGKMVNGLFVKEA